MNELEKLQNQMFMLQMKDSWTSEDFKQEDELIEKIKNIKKEQMKMKIKIFVGAEKVDENHIKVVRVEEEKAFKYAINKLKLTMKKDEFDIEKQKEFKEKLVKWYFQGWRVVWEDVD